MRTIEEKREATRKLIDGLGMELRKSVDGEYWRLVTKEGEPILDDSANEDFYCTEEEMLDIVREYLIDKIDELFDKLKQHECILNL